MHFPFQQNLSDCRQIHRHGYHRADKVGNGLGIEYGLCTEEYRKHKDRYKVYQLPPQAQRQRQLDLAHAGETVNDGILDTQRNGADRADFDRFAGLGIQFRIGSEEGSEQGSCHPGQHEHQSRIQGAQAHDVLFCQNYPVRPAGTIVKAQDALGAAADAAQRHGHHQHETLNDGIDGDQRVAVGAAVLLQQSIHGDDHHIVQRNDGKGRDAQLQYPGHGEPAVAAEGDADLGPSAEQEPQHECGAGSLADDGRQRCAANTHVKHKNKQRIQDDVHHCTDHDREHAHFCITLADDELVHARGKKGENRAADINGEVALCIRIGHITGAEELQHRFFQKQHRTCQDHCQHTQHHETVSQDLFGPEFVPFTQADTHQGRAADTDQKGKRADHGDDGTADTHTGQGYITNLRDIAHEDSVNDAVEHADKLGQHTGNRDAPDKFWNAVAAEIIFNSHNSTPFFSFSALYHSPF